MGVPPYILIQVMLEEHRQLVTRNMPGPDRPLARRVETTLGYTKVRRRLSHMLRAIADRLDPQGSRSYGVQLVVMPYPGDGGETARCPSAATRRETRR
jgi:hypothetical protein